MHTSLQTVEVCTSILESPPSPSHVTIRTKFSAISAGTELLTYNRLLPSNLPFESTFSSASQQENAPTSSGYSLVGIVENAPANSGFSHGDAVFCFHNHTSLFHALPSELQRIPNGISPLNAVLLPNVETALSLVMDANPLPGENVAVIGQGIVGLLTVAVLKQLHPMCKVIAIEPRSDRRQLAKAANANLALDPTSKTYNNDLREGLSPDIEGVDVAIEVSGTGSGLNCAIDATRDYGKVIIGSWYGMKEVKLDVLGGKFHRSHIQIIASQVSEVPKWIEGRWTKERRFRLAWDLVRLIEPAKRFKLELVKVERAQQAFRALSQGEWLQVVFSYDGE